MSSPTFHPSGSSRSLRSRRGSDIARLLGCTMEALEGRQLLAAISWDGGAGDNLWHSAANWSGDVVPTGADDVTIDVAGAPTILMNAATGSRAVNSLVLRENLSIGNATLTVGTTASIEGGAAVALSNGRLTGGTWSAAGGTLTTDSATDNRLTGLTWNGSISLPDASDRIVFSGAVAVSGGVTVAGTGAEIGMASGSVLSADVSFPGAAANRRMGATSSGITYTLGAGASIHGGAFFIGAQYGGSAWSNITVVNQGVITAESAGQTISINPATFTNAGVLNVNPGNVSIAATTSTSAAATLNVNGSLVIGGNYVTTTGIGTWNRTGGSVQVTGTVTNADGTLNLNTSTGAWELTGGIVTGGTVNVSGAGGLVMNSDPSNRLSSLTFNGPLNLADANDRLSLGTGVVMNGVITVSGANAELGLVSGAVLNSEVAFPGSTAGRRIGATSANMTYTLGPAANIHGGTFIIGNQYGGSAWSNVTVVGQGVITAETAGQTITINPATFTSTGTLNVNPGNLFIAATTSTTAGSTINVSGTLTFGGTYVTTTGIGTWTRSGGSVQISGVVTNTDGTLNLNSSTGPWELADGGINGGTVNISGTGALLMNSNPSNRLSSLTFNGPINLADANDRLALGTGVIMNGVITVTGANAELGLASGSTLNSEVAFPGSTAGRRIGATTSGMTYTLGSGASIHGGTFIIGNQYGGSAWSNVTVVNQGTITAETGGQTITINPATFTNAGTLNVNPGNVSILATTSTSAAATVNVNGTLAIGGNYVTTTGIGAWSRTGGSVQISGTVTNTDGTLNLNSSTGAWELTGGTITGGTLNLLSGGGLVVNSDPSNRLNNLTVNGDITLPDASDRLSFGQTVTINGVTTLSGANSELGLAAGAVLNSEVVFPGAATGRRIGATTSNMTYTLGPGANIHGGPFIIGNQYGGSAWNNVTVVNQGTIAADVAGQTAFINPAVFTNTGSLTAGPGNLTVNTSQTWSTTGTVTINNVTFSIDGTLVTAGGIGTWNRTGGTVNVPGVINNAGGTVNLNAGTGVWTLTGGSITGGVVNIGAGGGLTVDSNSQNRLQNLALVGSISLPDANDRLSFAQTVTVTGGLISVTGANAELGLGSGAVLHAEVSLPGNTAGRRIGATASNITYTLGAGANIHGGSFIIGNQFGGSAWVGTTIVNQGTITAETTGQTVTINGLSFTNQGTVQALAGNLTIAPTNAAFSNAGTLRIGAGSVVNVPGTFTQTSAGTLNIQVRGTTPADAGRLVVSGNAALDGTLTVQFTNGFSPDCMNVFFLDAAAVVGQFATANLPPPPADHQSLVVYFGNQVRFAISPPSDYNQDGILNSQDLFDFLTAFFAEKADFNGDGITNSQDFFDFLTDFFEGC